MHHKLSHGASGVSMVAFISRVLLVVATAQYAPTAYVYARSKQDTRARVGLLHRHVGCL